eukprot:262766_1
MSAASKKCATSINNRASKLLSQSENHLILHMDINKTIVMADTVQGKKLNGVINDTISECSWGKVYNIPDCPADYDYNKSFIINNTIWKPYEPYQLTPIQPNDDVISFMAWVKQQLPYPKGITDQVIKNKRRTYTLRFIELFDNKINAISKPYIEQYNQVLHKMETGGDNGQPIFIVPAFWNCIHHLVNAKRSFSIVFRSFGTDNHEVMQAFNAFCTEYGYDGSKPNVHNLILESKRIGAINCDTKNGKSLIIGVEGRNPMDRTKEIKKMTLDEFYGVDRMKWYYDKQTEEKESDIAVMCNEKHIYDYIKKESLKHKTMMFSDDYVWWSLHGENSDGGKMFILNDEDAAVHQIFFDDNLEFDRAGIVDVRKLNVNEGKKCVSDSEWNELKQKHLVRCEPLEVILDDDFFVRHIVQCETAFSKQGGGQK